MMIDKIDTCAEVSLTLATLVKMHKTYVTSWQNVKRDNEEML